MIRIEAPDGTIVEFPEGTDDATIHQAMMQEYGEEQASNTSAKGDMLPKAQNFHEAESAILGFANGVLFNYGSEAAGVLEGINQAVRGNGFMTGFEDGRQRANTMLNEAEEENPVSFGGGELGGSIATAVVPGTAALKAAQGAGKLKQATSLAAAGAGQGAVFGAGEDDSRLESATTGAATGAALGFLAPAAGRITGTIYNKLLKRNQNGVPTSEQLGNAGHQLYQEAEDLGIFIKESTVKGIINQLGVEARKAGSAKGIDEAPMRVLHAALTDTVGPQSIRQFEQLRQRLTRLHRETSEKGVRRITGELIGKFDRITQGLSPRDLAPGATDINTAQLLLRDARALWRTKSKVELVEDIIQQSRDAVADKVGGVGFEKQLRNRFKAIKNAKNKKVWNSFDKREKQAINKLIRFGVTDLTLEGLKVLVPSGQLGTVLTGGGGFVAGGVPGAIALVTGSKAARFGIDQGLKSRASAKADNLLSTISGVPQRPAPDPTIQLLTRRGLIGTGKTNE